MFLLIILLCSVLCSTFVLICSLIVFRKKISDVRKLAKKKEDESNLLRNFFHNLITAVSAGEKLESLHRLIVNSSVAIISAEGGVLYIPDSKENLLPVFVSDKCPPRVSSLWQLHVPVSNKEVKISSNKEDFSIQTVLKLKATSISEAIKSNLDSLHGNHVVNKDNISKQSYFHVEQFHSLESIIMAPLYCHHEFLGILVLAMDIGPSPCYTEKREILKVIAEQSAFALFNHTIYKTAREKNALDLDIQIASDLQKILFPLQSPYLGKFEINGLNLPAKILSGDYFDYIPIDNEHLGIAIADVSGKGIPAALTMTLCRSALRSLSKNEYSPSRVLSSVNRQLFADMKSSMFITMIYLILNKVTGDVVMAKAGHDAPLFYSHANLNTDQLTVKQIISPGMAIGVDSGEIFDKICTDVSFNFYSQDVLLLYTDGLTEALNKDGEEFGKERLITEFEKFATQNTESLLENLGQSVQSFTHQSSQNDDITLVVLRHF